MPWAVGGKVANGPKNRSSTDSAAAINRPADGPARRIRRHAHGMKTARSDAAWRSGAPVRRIRIRRKAGIHRSARKKEKKTARRRHPSGSFLWQWLARRQKPCRWLSSGFQPHGVFALFAAAYQPEDQQRAQQFADAHGYDGPGRGKADDEQKHDAVQRRAHKA